MEVDGGKFSFELESSLKLFECYNINKLEEVFKEIDKDFLDYQKRVFVEFEEEESQNESIDEENDGRLFIDIGGELGDIEGEELLVKKKVQYVEFLLVVVKFFS